MTSLLYTVSCPSSVSGTVAIFNLLTESVLQKESMGDESQTFRELKIVIYKIYKASSDFIKIDGICVLLGAFPFSE